MNQARAVLFAAGLLSASGCITADDTDENASDIVNGDPIPESQLPYVGMLVDFNASTICSATQLSDTVVLTAAHCVADSGDVSGLRFSNAAQFNATTKWTRVIDSRVQFLWPRGDITELTRGDLALVLLETPLPKPTYPQLLDNAASLRPGIAGNFDQMTIVGYGLNETGPGSTGTKRSGIVGFYGWSGSSGTPAATPNDFQLYLPLQGREELACPGDSGGPALLQTATGPVITGITHAGYQYDGPCSPENAVYYTSVSPYRSWILAKQAELTGRLGDLDRDGALTTSDLDAFGVGLRTGAFDPVFDINNDGHVDFLDGDELVLDLVGILYGDMDADGQVDGSDFLTWQRKLGLTTGKWRDGDMNFDGKTDARDKDIWTRNYGRQGGAVITQAAETAASSN